MGPPPRRTLLTARPRLRPRLPRRRPQKRRRRRKQLQRRRSPQRPRPKRKKPKHTIQNPVRYTHTFIYHKPNTHPQNKPAQKSPIKWPRRYATNNVLYIYTHLTII